MRLQRLSQLRRGFGPVLLPVRLWRAEDFVSWKVAHSSSKWKPFLALGMGALALGPTPANCEINRTCAERARAKVKARLESKGPVRADVKVDCGDLGPREVDFVDAKGGFHEVKTGRVAYNKQTKKQIEKDAQTLRNNPACKGFAWHLHPGNQGQPDRRVTRDLRNAGIHPVWAEIADQLLYAEQALRNVEQAATIIKDFLWVLPLLPFLVLLCLFLAFPVSPLLDSARQVKHERTPLTYMTNKQVEEEEEDDGYDETSANDDDYDDYADDDA
ncbi:unnamed protein product [Effrenium voratum]|nr:unnamed protein product [Effrenium voratum]